MPAFVSHKAEEKGIYSALCLALDGAGVPRWDPDKMSRGESLADQLRIAINKCEVCIFIATKRSVASSWCLSELGAFWGAGKRVLLFMAEPELKDSVLPPQFKGDLKVNTANELIEAAKHSIQNYNVDEASVRFFPTSGNYGTEKDWQDLLISTVSRFEVMGVALTQWRKTPNFRDVLLAKAQGGCTAKILLMHQENKVLQSLLYDDRNLDSIVHDIKDSHEYYTKLASNNSNIKIRQIINGIPHFFLTRTDQYAVLNSVSFFSDVGFRPHLALRVPLGTCKGCGRRVRTSLD